LAIRVLSEKWQVEYKVLRLPEILPRFVFHVYVRIRPQCLTDLSKDSALPSKIIDLKKSQAFS
jgi:hypothetical protein